MNRVIWAIRSISIATMASFNVKEALNFASSIFKLNFVFEFHVIFWVRWIVIKLICHRVLSHLNWFSGDTFGSKVKYFEHFAVCVNEKIHASNKTSKSLPNLILDLFEDFLFEVEGYLSFLGYPLQQNLSCLMCLWALYGQ